MTPDIQRALLDIFAAIGRLEAARDLIREVEPADEAEREELLRRLLEWEKRIGRLADRLIEAGAE